MIKNLQGHHTARIVLTFLIVLFMPVISVRYTTSPIVNCDGATCPEAFSIVEQYSPLNFLLTKYITHLDMPHIAVLPVTYLAILIALVVSFFAVSFILHHHERYSSKS